MRGEPFPLVSAAGAAGNDVSDADGSESSLRLDRPGAAARAGLLRRQRAACSTGFRGVSMTRHPPVHSCRPGMRTQPGAFSYFRELPPIDTIGHSINIYRLSAEDAAPTESPRCGIGGRAAPGRRCTVAHPGGFRQTYTCARSSSLTGPKWTSVSKPACGKQLRQVGAELGEDRIAPVAAGMADSRERDPRSSRRPETTARANVRCRPGQNRNGEDMPAARRQHAVDLARGPHSSPARARASPRSAPGRKSRRDRSAA